jgi:hypothetical protein
MEEGQVVLQLGKLPWLLHPEYLMLELYGDHEKEEIPHQECGHIRMRKYLITGNGQGHLD